MEITVTSSVPDHVPAELVHDFDIYNDDQIKRDLHAAYARLHREAPPVFYTPANGGHWLITRHDLMSEVVRDFETFRSEEHTSELQSLMRISYAVFCLKKKHNKHI